MKKYFLLIVAFVLLYYVGIKKIKYDYFSSIDKNISVLVKTLSKNINELQIQRLFKILHKRMPDFVYGIILNKKNEPVLIGNIQNREIKRKISNNKQVIDVLKNIKINPDSYYNSSKRITIFISKNQFLFLKFIKTDNFNIVLIFLNNSLRKNLVNFYFSLVFGFLFFVFLFIVFTPKKRKIAKKKKIKTQRITYNSNGQLKQLYEDKKNLQKQVDKLSFFREITLATNSMTDFEEMLKAILKVLSIRFINTNIIIYLGDDEQNLSVFFPKFGWIKEENAILTQNELMQKGYSYYESKVLEKEYVVDENILIIPLRDSENFLGFILFESENNIREIVNIEDVSFISKQLALAIKNSILYNLAITDGMTKLYLHRFFQIKLSEEIERSIRYKHPLSLILFDIDNFKKVNDTYGHQAGDYVLKTIASLVKGNIRKTDFAFRYGGEEMTILLPETPISDAFNIAEKIRKIVEDYNFHYQDLSLKITISLGVGEYKESETKENFINRVDEAMYSAKKSGKNKVLVSGF